MRERKNDCVHCKNPNAPIYKETASTLCRYHLNKAFNKVINKEIQDVRKLTKE